MKMEKLKIGFTIRILLLFVLIPSALYAQEGDFTIKGKLGNWNLPVQLGLQYQQGSVNKYEICDLVNGQFTVRGHLSYPVQAILVLYHEGIKSQIVNQDVRRIWLEPGNFEMTSPDSLKHLVITGSQLNTDQRELDSLISLTIADQNKTPAERDAEKKIMEYRFMKSHPNSLVSLQILIQDYGVPENRTMPDITKVEPIFNSFSANVRRSAMGLEYERKMTVWKKVGVGSLAPSFTQPDVNGKPISLLDYKGKYVLVDFWASWCHPCREENPNLMKQYEKYKGKNFTIVSISIDHIKANWIKAVKEDKLSWVQVSDLKKKNDAYLDFGVEAIPDNFLIDPDGKIIAKSLKGEELDKKLSEILEIK